VFTAFNVVAGAQSTAARASASPTELYRQLLSPVFKVEDVYHLRQVAIDREDLHVVLVDGTIALMQAVDGHVTGAFFEGEGEILLVPPNRAERTSLALFTSSGALDQKFQTAYLRFFDDRLFAELRSGFRPAENQKEFLEKWQEPARSLASGDSLSLLQAMTASGDASSRYLHLRLGGTALGVFDVFYDTHAPEQMSIAQAVSEKDTTYYNIWTSFPTGLAKGANDLPRHGLPIYASDFRIVTKVSPPTNLEAEAEITVVARRSGQRMVPLELSRYLKVSEAKMEGEPVPYIQNEAIDGSDLARRGNDIVAVVLPAALQQGRPTKLTLKYSGPVMFDTGGEVLYVGERGTWYPSPGVSFANYDLTFECPEDWSLVATGKKVSATAENGRQIIHFVSEKPISRAGFNLGRFETANAAVGAVVVESYAAKNVEQRIARAEAGAGLHPDPAKQVQKIAGQAVNTVQFLSRQLDAFPYSHLEVAQLPALLSQSWPGLIYLSSMAFLTPEERRAVGIRDPYAEFLMSDLMLAHETAHQWWGDAVDWESYRDQWIVEALANYCALLMLERDNPQGMKLAMEHYRKQLLQESANGILSDAGPVTLGSRLTSSRFPNAYDPVLYGRGTWLCHMLRSMLRQTGGDSSDALFFAALRSLLTKAPNGKISTADLQQAMEQVLPKSLTYEGKKSLDWFFDSWINGAAVPEFTLENVHMEPSGAKVKVSGVIHENHAPKDLITALPVYAVDKDGHSSFIEFVFADEPRTEFQLVAPAGAKQILLDPENTVLKR